ncbi:HI1506-related protein [Pseudomonas putida]|uniref:HI1506-related protein n=1 Tax=Pseudomonas putida TaxID=303 RepID=UPI00300F17C4
MGTVIKAKRDGYRRAGLAHKVAGTFYPDGDLSEQQLAVLRADAHLLVVEGVQEDALQADQDNAELLQEMGTTIAALEHDLEQARAGLKSACSDLVAELERQKAIPGLVVEALKLLEPADPAQEGVICIMADSLAALITEHLQPQNKTPEAQVDGIQSTLGTSVEPPSAAPVQAVAAATGDQSAGVSPEKAPGKRGKAAQKDAD